MHGRREKVRVSNDNGDNAITTHDSERREDEFSPGAVSFCETRTETWSSQTCKREEGEEISCASPRPVGIPSALEETGKNDERKEKL